MKADLLIDARNTLGEGIQWNARQQRLWWTDIHGRALWSCDADGGAVVRLETVERLGSFAFDPSDHLLAAFESGLFRWDIDGDRLERLTDFEPDRATTRLNDGRCDRKGRFITGGVEETDLSPLSSLIRFADGRCETLRPQIRCANSICFSGDGHWMYFADSPTREILRFPYDAETGQIGEPEVFHKVSEVDGVPDGSCIDAEDALWNARFNGGHVQRILRDGSPGLRIQVDAPQVTNCCFGGARLDRLYITTAAENMAPEDMAASPKSGGLFIAEPGVTGLPEERFAGRLFPS